MQSNVLQDAGKQTTGKKKTKEKEKKVFYAQVNCLCKKKCAERIDILKQQEIFEEYNKLNGWPAQTRYLRALISSRPTQENLDPIISTKQKANTYTYHFVDEIGSLTQVCLSFFTKLLQVERTKVFRAIDTVKTNPNAIERRGKSIRRKDGSDLKELKDFIGSFIVYESSRNPKKSHEKFLHPRLNIRKMYLLYGTQQAFRSRKVLSETVFRTVFHEMKVKFALRCQPKCHICEENKNNLENQPSLELNGHLDIVRSVKNELIDLVESAQMPTEKTEILIFKLQRAIDLPHISDNDIFFKQQLWCSVLTVYDQLRDITYFYVWNETIASRGSNEIISCLYKHFASHLPKDVEKIILFSDPSVTRNMKTSLMLQKFFDYSKCEGLTTIEQHFFQPNHCYSSCDRSFQIVESNMKLDEIFVQEDFIDFMKSPKKSNPKFVVTEMLIKNFYSTQHLENLLFSAKKTKDDQQIQWLEYQKIVYKRKQPFTMDVVKYGETSIQTITLQAKCIRDTFFATRLCYLNANTLKISKSKYDDLQTIMKYTPEKYHEYYRSLEFDPNDSNKTDYVLVEHQSSDEE